MGVALLLCVLMVPAGGTPAIEGSLETGGYVYPYQRNYFSGLSTQYRIYQNVSFDTAFNDSFSFRFNSRAAYQSLKLEAPDNWILNFYYGYLDYHTDAFTLQIGRIMDFRNLVYVYFDGLNIEGVIQLADQRLTLGCYGGFIVKDDYLEEDGGNYASPKNYSSSDYRSIFIKQRSGDYVAGTRLGFYSPKAGIFGLDYQVIFNHNDLAEHYVSLNAETMFSKMVKIYGYGTMDIAGMLPSNTLAAVQVTPVDFFSVALEHEYYRPVFLKNSYFWNYFKPYGNQEASLTFLFFISKPMILDLAYGLILYDSTSEMGNHFTCGFEHRDFHSIGINIQGELLFGPEGNKMSIQAMLRRRIYIFTFIGGGGIEFYNDDAIDSGYKRGYFATLGSDIEILRNLVLSATGEYMSDPDYRYNLRGIFSLKYNF